MTPVYVTSAIQAQLDTASQWKELALSLEQLHIHIANRTKVSEALRDKIRDLKYELKVGQWEGR